MSLYGDYQDLRSLHETIHTLCDGADGYGNQQDHVLSLAYEVRKAYEGQRLRKEGIAERNVYFGANLPWPPLLFYSSHLRQRAGFCPTNKEHQANLFRLEHCIERALLEYDHKIGKEILERFFSIGFVSNDFLFSFEEDVTYRYIYDGGTGKIRFRRLPKLLSSLAQWSQEYQAFAEYLRTQAERNNCSVYELTDMREWADFEW